MSGARVLKANPPPDTDIDYSSAIGEFAIGLSPIQAWDAPVTPPSPYAPGVARQIERLLDTVQGGLPGITLPAIELELENTVEEFCIRSTYFRSEVFWQMQPGVRFLALNPYDQNLVTIWVIGQKGLLSYHVDPPATLVDDQAPTSARTGSAVIVLKPRDLEVVKRGATPELFMNWWEVMLDGTLFRLYGMPAKPWSSPQLAQYHGARFRQGMNRARDVAERLNSPQQSPFRRFPYFARGRRKQ